MKRFALGLLALLLVPALAIGQTQVTETTSWFHLYKIPNAPSDFTLKLTNFDLDADGSVDFSKIVKVGWRTGGGTAPDTLCAHTDQGWDCVPLVAGWNDVIPWELRRFTLIKSDPKVGGTSTAATSALYPTVPDSAVFRIVQGDTTAPNFYLYVWGN